MKKIKIGVIIGRFQSKYLHEGHMSLYNEVASRSDEVIVLIGSAVPKLTNKNPLDYKTRELMIKSTFPGAYVAGIRDFNQNNAWSKNVDKTVGDIVKDEMIHHLHDESEFNFSQLEFEYTLYGCRDSFIPFYSGELKTEELLMIEVPGVNASALRAEIAKNPIDSEDFRAGNIYAVGNKYPTTYPTVDIAIMDQNLKILLGRKEFETQFRFIGGFVDPTDQTLEAAAYRECIEEMAGGFRKPTEGELLGELLTGVPFKPAYEGDVIVKDFEYVCSAKINDWRYRGTTDGIMTTMFLAQYGGGEVVASDDIFELKWQSLFDINKDNIVGEHYKLLENLKIFIANNYPDLYDNHSK